MFIHSLQVSQIYATQTAHKKNLNSAVSLLLPLYLITFQFLLPYTRDGNDVTLLNFNHVSLQPVFNQPRIFPHIYPKVCSSLYKSILFESVTRQQLPNDLKVKREQREMNEETFGHTVEISLWTSLWNVRGESTE